MSLSSFNSLAVFTFFFPKGMFVYVSLALCPDVEVPSYNNYYTYSTTVARFLYRLIAETPRL